MHRHIQYTHSNSISGWLWRQWAQVKHTEGLSRFVHHTKGSRHALHSARHTDTKTAGHMPCVSSCFNCIRWWIPNHNLCLRRQLVSWVFVLPPLFSCVIWVLLFIISAMSSGLVKVFMLVHFSKMVWLVDYGVAHVNCPNQAISMSHVGSQVSGTTMLSTITVDYSHIVTWEQWNECV